MGVHNWAIGDIITEAIMDTVLIQYVVNADVDAAAAIAWTKMAPLVDTHILVGDGSDDAVDVAVSGDITMANDGTVAIAAGVILDADVNASAAIAWSKMAALTAAHLLVGSAGGVATDVAITGDIGFNNTGVTAIAASAVVNADVNAAAAIAWSKMAALAATHILVGNGSNVAVDVAVSGDVSMANDGTVTIAANAATIAKVEDALLSGVVSVGPILQVDALSLTVYFPFKVTINKVRSFLTVVIGAADSVVTLKDHDGDAMGDGVLTIAVAGVAVADEDSCSPTTNNVIAAGEKIELAIDGGANAGEAIFFIEYTRTA